MRCSIGSGSFSVNPVRYGRRCRKFRSRKPPFIIKPRPSGAVLFFAPMGYCAFLEISFRPVQFRGVGSRIVRSIASCNCSIFALSCCAQRTPKLLYGEDMVRVRFIGWSSQIAVAMTAVMPFLAFEACDALRYSRLFCRSVSSKPAGLPLSG